MDGTELPDTAAGRQLGRCLSLVAAGDETAVEAVQEMFAPMLLADLPAGSVASHLYRDYRLESSFLIRVAVRGEHELAAVLLADGRPPMRFLIEVERAAPHRFVRFDTGPAPLADPHELTWNRLLGAEPEPRTTGELPADITDRLDQLVQRHRATRRVPGIIAAVADSAGHLQWIRREGVAGLEPMRPPTRDVALRIGSISKTMTATAVLQLVERNLIELDAPVNDLLTSCRVHSVGELPITIRHLLSHTSGLSQRAGIDIGVDEGQPVPPLSEFYAGGLHASAAAGSTWVYSNDGFAVLEQLVTDVTAESLPDYAARNLFDVLGMTSTSYLRDTRIRPQPFQGLDVELDNVVPTPYRDIIIRGAGSVFSTVDDMALYGAAVLGGGANRFGRMLATQTLDLMFVEQPIEMPDERAVMGLGWMTLNLDGVTVRWHNGGWYGAKAGLAIVPSLGVSVLAFGNTLTSDLDELCFGLVGALAASQRG